MSLLREIMDESQGVVNDILGHAAIHTNTLTSETTPVSVVIKTEVKLYQDGIFGGIVSTAVFDRQSCDPKIGDLLNDLETNTLYSLDAVLTVTPAKIEFILGEE